MRVRFLIAQFHPRVGGAERQALLQARTLVADGHEVVVHTLRYSAQWPARETIDGVQVRRHGGLMLGGRLRLGHGLQWLTGLLILLTLLRERNRFDALHVHQLSWLAYVGVALLAIARKTVVVKVGSASATPVHVTGTTTLHVPLDSFVQSDTVALGARGGVGRWLLIRSGISLVATSTRMANELRALGWPPQRLHVVPNGVVLPPESDRAPLPNTQRVVTVARLSYEKGIDTLLDAWAQVVPTRPDAHLVIVGGGRLDAELRAYAARLGIDRSVTFRGHVDDPSVEIREADIFVLPSRYEGMPNALLEALTYGLPAVATRVSGSEDLVDDGRSGLLVEPEDPDAMAQAIGTLLDSSKKRHEFGQRAWDKVRAGFGIRDVTRQYLELYAAPPPGPGALHQMLAAAALLMTATLATKCISLVNQVVASSHFGAGAAMDAYFAVLAVPVFATSIITATLTSAVVPEYARRRSQHGPRAAAKLFRTLLWSTTGLSLLISTLLVSFGPWVVRVTAPGLNPDQVHAAELLVPYIYPLLAINTAIGVITGMVNAEGRFGVPAYAGALVPICMIAATLALGPTWGVTALALGMLVGSCLQLAVTLYVAARAGLSCNPFEGFVADGLVAVAKSIAPLAMGVVIVQLSPLIDQIVASWLPVGSLSAISYSLKLIDIPVVALFMTASRVLLPRFSAQASVGDYPGLERTLGSSLRLMTALVLPISLFFIVLSVPLVRLFYQRGAFGEDAVQMTAGCLVAFSLGLVPMGLGFILPKVFNAIGRNSVLAWFSLVTLVSNGALDIVLAHFWQHVGIALSTSLTYTIVTVGMLVLARRMLRSEVRVSGALQYTAS